MGTNMGHGQIKLLRFARSHARHLVMPAKAGIHDFGSTAILFHIWEHARSEMQIIAKRRLRSFWEKHPHAETPLKLWFMDVSRATWAAPAAIRAQFSSADFLHDNRVIFDVGGNKFRLVVHVAYQRQLVLIKFIGTHKDYDKIDPETVE